MSPLTLEAPERECGSLGLEGIFAFAKGLSFCTTTTFKAGADAQMMARWVSISVHAWVKVNFD